MAPRIFLKKLIVNVLDKVDQYEAFDPTKDYELVLDPTMDLEHPEERAAAEGTAAVEDIELDL